MDFGSLLPQSVATMIGAGDFSTPVGAAIEKATSEMQIGPDWGANMQICDMINHRSDGVQSGVKALKRRLKNDNPKVVTLALLLCEACVKNCGFPLHAAVEQSLLADVAGLTDGRRGWEVREKALALIQQWAAAFQGDRALGGFTETYSFLRRKGIQFPQGVQSAPVFTPPATRVPAGAAAAGGAMDGGGGGGGGGDGGGGSGSGAAAEEPTPEQELAKLSQDVDCVQEKVVLCQQMLPNSPGVAHDEAFAEVIGFLEACRPRMAGLIEAGLLGALGEELFERCLKVNDALLRTLEAERTGRPLPPEAAADLGGGGGEGGDSGGGGGAAVSANTVAAAAAAAGQPSKPPSTASNDPFDLDSFVSSLPPTVPPPSSAGATVASSSNLADDDFDEFLARNS